MVKLGLNLVRFFVVICATISGGPDSDIIAIIILLLSL